MKTQHTRLQHTTKYEQQLYKEWFSPIYTIDDCINRIPIADQSRCSVLQSRMSRYEGRFINLRLAFAIGSHIFYIVLYPYPWKDPLFWCVCTPMFKNIKPTYSWSLNSSTDQGWILNPYNQMPILANCQASTTMSWVNWHGEDLFGKWGATSIVLTVWMKKTDTDSALTSEIGIVHRHPTESL